MDCTADKKQKVRRQPGVKRLEAPRKERLDLTFRVIPKTISVEAVASASGLSPEDVSKGLDALRDRAIIDTLVTNLFASLRNTLMTNFSCNCLVLASAPFRKLGVF